MSKLPALKASTQSNTAEAGKSLEPLGSGISSESWFSHFFPPSSYVWTGLLLEKARGKDVCKPQCPQVFGTGVGRRCEGSNSAGVISLSYSDWMQPLQMFFFHVGPSLVHINPSKSG